MKKVLVVLLTVVMMMSMTVTVFAAGGFVSSPTVQQAPGVISFEPADDDCTGRLVITPYGERDELTTAQRTFFEKAYNEIKGSTNLTELCAALKKIAANKKIKAKNLAVSELFDIHVTGCDYHDEHYDFDVVLDPESLKNFVALIHMNKEGNWEVVEGAKVIANGDHLAFSVDSFSPFAIVINNSAKPSQTGDNSLIPVYATVMAVSALAIVVILAKSKKREA